MAFWRSQNIKGGHEIPGSRRQTRNLQLLQARSNGGQGSSEETCLYTQRGKMPNRGFTGILLRFYSPLVSKSTAGITPQLINRMASSCNVPPVQENQPRPSTWQAPQGSSRFGNPGNHYDLQRHKYASKTTLSVPSEFPMTDPGCQGNWGHLIIRSVTALTKTRSALAPTRRTDLDTG